MARLDFRPQVPVRSEALVQQRKLRGPRLHLVENVASDLRHLVQFSSPRGMDVSRVIVRCVTNLVDPHFASDDLIRQLHRGRPLFFFFDRVVLAGARERELAAGPIAFALIDHATDRLRIERAADTVHYDLRDGKLTSDRLVASFEVDCCRHAAHLARTELVLGQTAEQSLGLLRRKARILEKARPLIAGARPYS